MVTTYIFGAHFSLHPVQKSKLFIEIEKKYFNVATTHVFVDKKGQTNSNGFPNL